MHLSLESAELTPKFKAFDVQLLDLFAKLCEGFGMLAAILGNGFNVVNNSWLAEWMLWNLVSKFADILQNQGKPTGGGVLVL